MPRHAPTLATAFLILGTLAAPAGAQQDDAGDMFANPGGEAASVDDLFTAEPPAQEDRAAAADDGPLDWESANARRMFILVNNGHHVSAIAVDTTKIEDLQAALKLQELVFRISGTRMPIVDREYVRVPWGMIHLTNFPAATPRAHPYEIRMQEMNPTSYNPPKQIRIDTDGRGLEEAVSAFTKETLGVPLSALEDEDHEWPQRKVVAIPEKMETIYGSYGRPGPTGGPGSDEAED